MKSCPQRPFLTEHALPDSQSPEELLDFATGTGEAHTDLDLSLQINRQLHATLRRKQEEIRVLKETNAQLRDLATQTRHYATALDALTSSPQRHPVSSEQSWLSLLTRAEAAAPSSPASPRSTSADAPSPAVGLPRRSWSSYGHLLCREVRFGPSGSKQPRLQSDLVQVHLENLKALLDPDEQTPRQLSEDPGLTRNQRLGSSTPGVNVFGAFCGLRVLTQTPPIKPDLSASGDDGAVCFKTAVRDHSTVKTKVFPHGKAFTSHTPSGSCRFLWVPEQLHDSKS